MLENINAKNEKVIFEGLICAIDMHRHAMELVCKNYIYKLYDNIYIFLFEDCLNC